MKCKACDRGADKSGFCEFHARARQNITSAYDAWRKALGIGWQEYLSEIVKNPLTGEWAREVVEQLIKTGEKQDVAES